MKVLNRNQEFNVNMVFREEVLSSISTKIDSKFKRTKPRVCEYRDYERNKSVIHDEVIRTHHHSERDWPECYNVLLESIKKEPVQELETVSSESENEFVNDSRQPLSMASRSYRKSKSRSPR